MKRIAAFIFSLTLILSVSLRAEAAEALFEEEISELENSLPDNISDDLSSLGIEGINGVMNGGVDINALFEYFGDTLAQYSGGPLSSLIVLISIVIIASVAEAYTYSLRYTHTKEVMGAAVSLMIVLSAVTPAAQLAVDTVSVISAASSVMLLYIPVMAGILIFSGRAITSTGYYAAVVTGAGLASKLASTVLSPLLNVFLSLAVCSGICVRINLNGLMEMSAKFFKWLLTFSVSMFTAVVGLNAALAETGNELTDRAARLTLTSFIPLIGSSVAEAYRTLKSSVDLLRGGMGVFVIVALLVSFAPVMLRALLWSGAVFCAKLAAEAFGVSSAVRVLSALASYLSALRALLTAVLVMFVISTSFMMRIGGSG